MRSPKGRAHTLAPLGQEQSGRDRLRRSCPIGAIYTQRARCSCPFGATTKRGSPHRGQQRRGLRALRALTSPFGGRRRHLCPSLLEGAHWGPPGPYGLKDNVSLCWRKPKGRRQLALPIDNVTPFQYRQSRYLGKAKTQRQLSLALRDDKYARLPRCVVSAGPILGKAKRRAYCTFRCWKYKYPLRGIESEADLPLYMPKGAPSGQGYARPQRGAQYMPKGHNPFGHI